MMTPTRFEFEILQNQVDFLRDSFNWVVGGIGIVIAIALVVIGYVIKQSNSRELRTIKEEAKAQTAEMVERTFNELQQKIDDTYRNLEEMVQSKTKDVIDEMYEHVDTKHSEMESIVNTFKNSANGQLARIYAVANADKEFWAQSFGWWLTASHHYNEIADEYLKNLSLENAQSTLEKILAHDKNNIEKLWEGMDENNKVIAKLKSSNPIVTSIEKLMLEKANLPKEKPARETQTT